MKQIDKTYTRSFLLEPTKVQRLVDKMRERLSEHRDTTMFDRFEVFLAGTQREEMTSVDDVLALDNSARHKIKRLLIVSSAVDGHGRPTREIRVDFNSAARVPNKDTKTAAVEISVRGEAGGWANSTLSELEEQVERTLPQYMPPVLVLVGILCCAVAVLASRVEPIPRPTNVERTMWLNDADLDRVEEILGEARPITDQEMREIVTLQLQNVVRGQRPKEQPQEERKGEWLVLVVPLLFIVGCATFLLISCYPSAVFLWGEEIKRYEDILYRRRTTWNILWGVTVVGVFGNLLSQWVMSRIP